LNKVVFHFTASGCYTALCLASISLSTDVILLKKTPDWVYFIFLFFATFLYYNFHKISWFGHARMLKKNNLKYFWPAQYPGLLLFCLIVGFAGSAALVTFTIKNATTISLGLLAVLLSMLYNQKFLGIHLRSSKGMKAFTIGLVSIITGVLIPVAHHTMLATPLLFLLLYSLSQFLFISALCIAADLRDIDEDREDHIKTFPLVLGIKSSKRLIVLMLITQLLLLLTIFNSSYISIAQFEVYLLISMLSMLFINQLDATKSYFYFILGIDGLIACQALCLLFFIR
jgi:4-hydroxybenzoate polyprenyltransferase